MAVSALLRFGLLGTLVLSALPVGFAGRYLTSPWMAYRSGRTRSVTDDERARLDTAGGDVAPVDEVLVATDADRPVAGVTGTSGNRLVILSESTLDTASTTELTGLLGIAAGKHETRLPELYTGYLVGASATFAVLVGVDPDGLPSPLVAGLLVCVSLLAVGVGHQLLRRRVYSADRAAARRVGRDSVVAAIRATPSRRLPDWVPDVVHPTPSDGRRCRNL